MNFRFQGIPAPAACVEWSAAGEVRYGISIAPESPSREETRRVATSLRERSHERPSEGPDRAAASAIYTKTAENRIELIDEM
jgi:hypothetical protein